MIRARGHKQPAWIEQPLFGHLHMPGGDATTSGSKEQGANYKALFETAGSLEAAGAIVTEVLVKKLSSSLAISPTDIDTTRPLHFYSVDSLVAVELRNWFVEELSSDVAIFSILGNSSCEAIGLLAAGKSAYKLDAWGIEQHPAA